MPQTIGVDYGTRAMKAVAYDCATGRESVPSLGQNDPFFQAAAELRSHAENRWVCGPPAHDVRRLRAKSVASAFRDDLMDASSTVNLNGESVPGAQVMFHFFAALGARLQETVPDAKAVCLSVPDHWMPGTWSLPIALHQAGWRPQLLVREFAAVLASQDAVGNRAVLVSLGFGPMRATLVERRESHWKAVATAAEASVSGKLLRQRLATQLADDIVAAIRYNPLENREADQALQDAIEHALRQLQSSDHADLALEVKGRHFNKRLLPTDVEKLAVNLSDSFTSLLKRLEVSEGNSPNVIAWGELTNILGLKDLLPGQSITIAPQSSVAAGAARISEWFSHQNGGELSLPGVSTANGQWINPPWTRDHAAAAIPVLQYLPASYTDPNVKSRETARLVQITPHTERRIVAIHGGQCRLGRHPDAEIRFEAAAYPQVSQFHAEIRQEQGQHILSDLASTNGTHVNGERIKNAVVLSDGDIIRLGKEDPQLRFENKPPGGERRSKTQ